MVTADDCSMKKSDSSSLTSPVSDDTLCQTQSDGSYTFSMRTELSSDGIPDGDIAPDRSPAALSFFS